MVTGRIDMDGGRQSKQYWSQEDDVYTSNMYNDDDRILIGYVLFMKW